MARNVLHTSTSNRCNSRAMLGLADRLQFLHRTQSRNPFFKATRLNEEKHHIFFCIENLTFFHFLASHIKTIRELVPTYQIIEFLKRYRSNAAIVADSLLLFRLMFLSSAERNIDHPRELLQLVFSVAKEHATDDNVISATLELVLAIIPTGINIIVMCTIIL